MRELLEQIRMALNANLYYLSLYVSLTLPDICGAMASANGHVTAQKYKAWFDTYVAPKYRMTPSMAQATGRDLFLTAEECYIFRNSVLHQGSVQHPSNPWERIWFFEPGSSSVVAHCNIVNNTLNLDVSVFCGDVINGVEEWLNAVEGIPQFQNNYARFMQRYPNGMPPLTHNPIIT